MGAAAAALGEAQVPGALAARLAACSHLPTALDVTEVAWRCVREEGRAVAGRGVRPERRGEASRKGSSSKRRRRGYGVDGVLDLAWLQARIAELPGADRWQTLFAGRRATFGSPRGQVGPEIFRRRRM